MFCGPFCTSLRKSRTGGLSCTFRFLRFVVDDAIIHVHHSESTLSGSFSFLRSKTVLYRDKALTMMSTIDVSCVAAVLFKNFQLLRGSRTLNDLIFDSFLSIVFSLLELKSMR